MSTIKVRAKRISLPNKYIKRKFIYGGRYYVTDDSRYFEEIHDYNLIGEIGDLAWVAKRVPLPRIYGEVFDVYQITIHSITIGGTEHKQYWLGNGRFFLKEIRKPTGA